MVNVIVARNEEQVKSEGCILSDPPGDECGYDGCYEAIFRYGLCWDHFIAEETARWDDWRAEREICLAGVGL